MVDPRTKSSQGGPSASSSSNQEQQQPSSSSCPPPPRPQQSLPQQQFQDSAYQHHLQAYPPFPSYSQHQQQGQSSRTGSTAGSEMQPLCTADGWPTQAYVQASASAGHVHPNAQQSCFTGVSSRSAGHPVPRQTITASARSAPYDINARHSSQVAIEGGGSSSSSSAYPPSALAGSLSSGQPSGSRRREPSIGSGPSLSPSLRHRPAPHNETARGPQAPHEIRHFPESVETGAPSDDHTAQDAMLMEEDDPVEVALHVDVPKVGQNADGSPIQKVLSVHPSWYCVFSESVVRGMVRVSLKIRYCPDPTKHDLLKLVRRIQSLQVISYKRGLVELTLSLSGDQLLSTKGFTVHLDPPAISCNNNASYGFSISLSSYPCRDLTDAKPDTPIPLSRQKNSAYCRRNLKELLNDRDSSDVEFRVPEHPPGQPSSSHQGRKVFYAHSAILEAFSYFNRLVLPENSQENDEVDENGLARSLEEIDRYRAARRQQRAAAHGPPLTLPQSTTTQTPASGSGSNLVDHRRKVFRIDNTSAATFEAVLNFIYTHHILTPETDPQNPMLVRLAWREIYEAAHHFELMGLKLLAKLALVMELEPELAVRELFGWAYKHPDLRLHYIQYMLGEVSLEYIQDFFTHDQPSELALECRASPNYLEILEDMAKVNAMIHPLPNRL